MANTQFISGQSVVYPGHGVGVVVETVTEMISAEKVEVIVVAFDVGMKLRLPVRNIGRCGLRGISSRRTMQYALEKLSEPRPRKKPMWRHRALEYTAKIKTGDPGAIAEIVRDLHRAPGQSEASYSEKTIYQQAWDHLIPEVAAVDRTDKETAAKKIVGLLEAA